MPEMDRLTKVEAQERAALISNPVYRPILRLASASSTKTFSAESRVEFQASRPGASSFIDVFALRITEATLNGVPIDLARYRDGRLPLDNLQAHNTVVVKSLHPLSNTGAGLSQVIDSEDGRPYLHTQFEHNHAHKVFACFDQPDIKGHFSWTVEAPTALSVLTNTAPVQTIDLGGGMQRTEFVETERISTYLCAMVAGPFAKFEDSYTSIDGRVIPLALYTRASQAQDVGRDAAEWFEITKAGLRAYEEEFQQPYPFPKYDQVIVPGFKAGAMENPGLVTFAESVIFRGDVPSRMKEWRAEVILHEMAHMWFGDLVTMEWWQDLWLNESFATFMATRMQDRITKYTNALVTANGEKLRAAILDQRSTTHPIVTVVADTDGVHENFDAITYEKGAAALRQLVAYVGEQEFVAGLRQYFRTYRFKNATLDNFLGAIQDNAPGKDVRGWAKQWLEQAGVNVLTPSFDVDAAGRMHNVVITQTAARADHPTLRTHVMNVGLYDLDGAGRLVLRRSVPVTVSGDRTLLTSLDGEKQPALLMVNDGDLTYTKIRFDKGSLATVATRLSTAKSPLLRAQLWSALWDMTRDAELPARRFVDLVARHAGGESEPAVVDAALARAAGAIDLYASPRIRDQLRGRLAEVSLEQLQRADLEPTTRLSWFEGFLANSTVRDRGMPRLRDVALLHGMLNGTRSLPGITLDKDTRWKVVVALAGAGVLDESALTTEAQRDTSIQGERSYLQAMASRPTVAAKAEAYRMLTGPQPGDPQMTPWNMRALMAGFGRSGQEDLVRPFALQYPAMVDKLSAERTQEEAQELIAGLFPPVGQTALRAGAAALTQPHLTPSGRRVIVEALDGTERAIRARRLDALEGPLLSLPQMETRAVA